METFRITCQTGSKSVITFNLNRLIQLWYRKESSRRGAFTFTEEYYPSLRKYLSKLTDRVYKYHHAYNELMWDMYDAGLLPAYSAGFIDLNKQYLTLGLNGLNQAAEFLGIKCNDNKEYARFCKEIFSFFKEQNELHNDKTSKHKLTFNTELVPAEALASRNYNWDRDDGFYVPRDTNLYASYIFKPNDPMISVLEKIRLHGKDYIGDYLDGGSALHANLDSHLSVKQYKYLLEYAAKVGCNYLTFNIPMSECDDCGHIVNAPVNECPKCHSNNISYATRIIGYLTKVKNWNDSRKKEFETRVFNHVDEDDSGEYTKFNKYKAK
jgi:ribonucleoside-triphosphate reductase